MEKKSIKGKKESFNEYFFLQRIIDKKIKNKLKCWCGESNQYNTIEPSDEYDDIYPYDPLSNN